MLHSGGCAFAAGKAALVSVRRVARGGAEEAVEWRSVHRSPPFLDVGAKWILICCLFCVPRRTGFSRGVRRGLWPCL